MTVKKTQQTLSTTLEKTEQSLNGLETALENNVGGRSCANKGNDALVLKKCIEAFADSADERIKKQKAKTFKKGELSDFRAEITSDWYVADLFDVTHLITCGVAKKPDYVEEGVPFLSAQNARPFKANLNKIRYITQEAFESITVGGAPQKGDVLYTRVGNCGEAAKVTFDFDFGVYVSLTLIKPVRAVLDSDYLVAFLNSRYGLMQAGQGAIGIGLKNLNVDNVRRYIIPLPPLAEQTIIAQTLDTLLAQVDNIKIRLDAIPKILKTFRQSVLAAAVNGKLTEEWRGENECGEIDKSLLAGKFELADDFSLYEIPSTWYFSPIGNVADFQQGMQIAKSTRHKEDGEGRLPILRIGNYSTSFTDDVDYVDIDESSLIAEPEDIILTRTGESRGRVLTGFRGVFHNNTFRINYNTELLVRSYLIYLLNNNQIHDFILVSSGRSAQPDLTHKKFGPCPVSLPPLNEQTQIVHQVEELFAFADQIEQQVKNAQGRVNNLTQSILAKAFRGELTTQWRAENPDLISGDNSAEALLAKIKEERENLKPKKSVKNKSNAKTE